MLGRIQPAHFPKVFGPGADEALDGEVVRARFEELAERMSAAGKPMSAEDAAAGALQIAVGAMANAIKRISVARGYDVTGYTLQCFGGAGGQAACLVADALGMTRILAHPFAGVLSAYGMGLADQTAMREASIERPLDTDGLGAARETAASLATQAGGELRAQGVPDGALRTIARAQVRYQGTDTALTCPLPLDGPPQAAIAAIREAFEQGYRRRFAFLMPDRALVIEAVSVEALAAGASLDAVEGSVDAAIASTHRPDPLERVRMYCLADDQPAGWRDAELHHRESLRPGARIDGPAIVAERNATTVVDAGWRAELQSSGDLLLTRVRERARSRALGTEADPVVLEVFNNLFMNIAEQMGLRLQNTAYSVNIKERLDFSCALFDGQGQLIANAPHMPVHLGSMSESIRSVIERNPAACAPATSTCSTTRTTAARTCPTSPSSRRCSSMARPAPASSSPAAATTPTSAASRRARCRRSRATSPRRAC